MLNHNHHFVLHFLCHKININVLFTALIKSSQDYTEFYGQSKNNPQNNHTTKDCNFPHGILQSLIIWLFHFHQAHINCISSLYQGTQSQRDLEIYRQISNYTSCCPLCKYKQVFRKSGKLEVFISPEDSATESEGLVSVCLFVHCFHSVVSERDSGENKDTREKREEQR